MRDNSPTMLRDAAKKWRGEHKIVGVGEMRYDFALEEAADAIEGLQKRVPKVPHGRLIDADALAEYVCQQSDWLSKTAIHTFCGILRKAPTIIPAEEEKS